MNRGGALGKRLDALRINNESLMHGAHRSLEKGDIKAIALSYVDNSGLSRVKAIPFAKLESALAKGVGMSPVFDAFLFDDTITASAYSGGPIGDIRLFPDLESMALVAGAPGWAWAPAIRFSQDGEEYSLCHRSYAARTMAALAEVGIVAKMSFEIEWIVSDGQGDEFIPGCDGPAYGLERIVELGDYLLDILRALEIAGIEVEQVHPEYAPGQFEISVAPLDPVRAADASVLVKHIIRSSSSRFGLRASFAPSVVAGGVGNGGHLHCSFWRDGLNLFSGGSKRNGLTDAGESILAGVLKELPALCAIGAPSVASYLRLVPQHWAGVFRCWGVENREAALRLVEATTLVAAESANAELKPFDLSSSPYLTVGAVAAVAKHYFDKSLSLPEPVGVDPASLSPDELVKLGIERLPKSVGEALDCLYASKVITESLGEELLTAFAAVRVAEVGQLDGKSPEEVVAATRWKY